MRATVFRTATAMTVGVSLLALAACSPGSNDGDLDWEDSPLQAHFADLYEAMGTWDEDDINEREMQVQELVAACMKAEGFEYQPFIPDMIISLPSPGQDDDTEDLWQPEKREWVEKYGYGIVNDPWRLNGDWDEAPNPDGEFDEGEVDPNYEYYMTLSESEQQAYDKALYGGSAFIEWEEGEEMRIESSPDSEQDWGCYGRANDEVFSDMGMEELQSVWEDPQFQGVMEAMNNLYSEQENNPANAELERKWVSCMADGGHGGFLSRYEPENSIHEELEPFFATEVEDVWSLPDVIALGEREIELALVDFDCREEIDYDNELLRIQFAAEEQFIKEYKVELDALKQALEQANATS